MEASGEVGEVVVEMIIWITSSVLEMIEDAETHFPVNLTLINNNNQQIS